MSKNLFEFIQEKQNELLKNITDLSSFGSLKEANGILIDRDGLSGSDAEKLLRNIQCFKKEWSQYKAQPSIVLHKGIFERTIRYLLGVGLELEINSDKQAVVSVEQYALELAQFSGKSISFRYSLKEKLGASSLVEVVLRMFFGWGLLGAFISLIISAVVVNHHIFSSLLFWVLSLFFLFLGVFYRIKSVSNSIKNIKNKQKVFETIYPRSSWNTTLFFKRQKSSKAILIRVLFESSRYKINTFLSCLNILQIKAINKKGKLIFYLHKDQSEFKYDILSQKLEISSAMLIVAEFTAADKEGTKVPYVVIDSNNTELTPAWICSAEQEEMINQLFQKESYKLFF